MIVDGRRLARLRTSHWPEGADALVVSGSANRRYLIGSAMGVALWVTRQDAALLVGFTEAEAAATLAAACPDGAWRTVALPAGAGGVGSALGELAGAAGARRIAFEGQHLTVAAQRGWREQLGGAELVEAGEPIERMREVKEPEELAVMRRAAALMDAAWQALLPRIRAGVSEIELGLELEFDLRRRGAEGVAFPFIVASGPRGALPHGEASQRILAPGDLVTFDVGARVDGYCSDMTRTVAVGEPGPRAREVYAAVNGALDRALAGVRAGAGCRAVDALARDALAAAGLGDAFGHGLGHGVGLDVHERPSLSRRAREEAVLRSGMVVTIEPGVYLPGWGGVRVEEEVVVTDGGYELLTRSGRDLEVLGG